MNRVAIAGLCKVELPTATLRLSDGPRIIWGAETYTARDATFGVIGGLETIREGGSDTMPPLELTLLPPGTESAVTFVQPAMQGSRVRFWIAEYTPSTGFVDGTPELRFDGYLDQAMFNLRGELNLTLISKAAQLFEQNIGNSLSPAFHKTVWPGETGHDNATGVGKPVAWGTTAPTPGTTGFSTTLGGAPWALSPQTSFY